VSTPFVFPTPAPAPAPTSPAGYPGASPFPAPPPSVVLGTVGSLQHALAGSSFTFEDTASRPRMVISLEGLDGCGKTHFALGAPSKRGILYMGTDIGMEGVADKFEAHLKAQGRIFGKAEYFLNIPNGSSPSAIQDLAQQTWSREARDFEIAVRSGASTIVIDTASEIYEHLTLARFGKLSEVPPNQWGITAQEYSQLLRQVYNSDTNLILLHKLKKEYANRNPTGRMVRKGFNDTNYLVQVSVVMSKLIPQESIVGQELYSQLQGKLVQGFKGVTVTEKVFLGQITKCRQNTQLEGMTFVNPTFADIARVVLPAVDPSNWD
jgi:hypothetical protein